ncbi:competence protein [Treponema socranskii subsp. socranskii VPI DR56BR1116 = ATCC 35536]|uniref:Competence protein n=1 Tax=Treponema socranskii subsp. socranskii VPI DR56BR1116 = ATCC 35536 TaxID=1125725 RepID=U2L2N1_TRESO|nr:ComEC/Rec2 family competence protein [Treponema socranskii]ERF61102.1 competence protein [Treponema socranskii subsp. socranskii VPI DR56BR1116 = ATCC 35536]ERK04992.1 competence protein [Treponema socranskii subsp. socranskii VPI DR56BR1116 = ATCC 35536]
MVIGKRLKHPLFCAVLISSVLAYGGIVPVKNRHAFASLVPPLDIVSMYGTVVSNPVKSQKRGAYSLEFAPDFVVSKGGVKSSARGHITAVIDEKTVEAYFPGKLYSASYGKGAVLCESGARLFLSGRAGKSGVFFVSKAESPSPEKSFTGKLSRIRALSRLQFRRLMYAWGGAGGLLLALLSGSREYTERAVSDAFRNAGLSHILALSGMHLSLVSGIALFAGMRLFGKTKSYIFQFCAVSLFVWFAGFSPSLLRAFLCNVLLLLCSVCGIAGADTVLILCAAFILHVLIAPAHILSAAFMLSYGALLGILLFSETLNAFLIRALGQKISAPLSASLGAQTLTAPVTLSLFGTFMPVGVIATALVSPLVTVFIYAGIVCIALSLALPFFAPLAGAVMNAIYGLIKLLVLFFARAPYVHIA